MKFLSVKNGQSWVDMFRKRSRVNYSTTLRKLHLRKIAETDSTYNRCADL